MSPEPSSGKSSKDVRPITVMSFDPAIRTYYERHPSIPSNTPPPSITAAIHQHHQVTSPLANTTTATAAAVEEEEDFEDDEDDDEFYEDDDDYEEEEEGDNPFGDVASPMSTTELDPYSMALKDVSSPEKVKNVLKSGVQREEPLDFSKINLSDYSPEQIEALYKAKHLNSTSPPVGIADTTSGFHPSSYPTSMTVTIESVNLPSRQSDRPVLYRVVFRGRKLDPVDDSAPNSPTSTPSHRLSHQMVYRTGLTYHSLLFDSIKIDVHDLPKSPLLPYSHIGRARIRLSDLDAVSGSLVRSFPLEPKKASKRSHKKPSSIGHITISVDFSRSVEEDADDGVFPDDSASVIGDFDDEPQFGTRVTSIEQGEAVVEEFMGYFRAVQKTDPEPSLLRSNSTASFLSPSLARSQTLAGTILKFDAKPKGKLVSHRTLTGLQEMSNIAAAFFNHGWPITKLEFTRALLLMAKWQSRHQPQHRTHDAIVDPRRIRVATYLLRYTVATYGTVVMNFLGAGKGYVRDTLRPKADRKCAVDYLGCKEEDMLMWEFSGVEAFKPKFFVAWDEKTRAVVVSIRGTLNIHEVVTDMCAEYEPHRTGFAHRGMLRCALWLEHHLIPLLIPHLRDRRARALYLVGHSLGGSIAALLTMLIRDNEALMGELRTLKGFRLHSFGFGSPPCVSGELADGLAGWVDSYTNENDTVPRLSYGSLCDFRDLVIKAAELQKTKLSELDRFTALTTHQTHLHTSNLSPKVYVPGTVHYIYKTSRVLKKTTHVPTSGVKAVDDERPHYVLERSDRHRFLDVQVKLDMLWDHIPSRYENGLKKAHDWLLEHHVEDGEPDTPLSAPVTSKGFLGMFGRRHKNSQHASTM